MIHIGAGNPLLESLAPAIEVIKAGGVVAYPTETFYGLGVDALNEKAVEKIFAIKKRDFSQPLLILIPGRYVLSACVTEIPDAAVLLMEAFWPGPLTIIFFASSRIPPLLCAHTEKVAVRVSSHPVSQALVQALNAPLTATSANLSGLASPTTADEVWEQLGVQVDVIIDGGKTFGGKPSTIVDVTQSPPRVVREGVIPKDEIGRYF